MKMESTSRFFPEAKALHTLGVLVGGVALGLIVLILLGLPTKWLIAAFGGFSILLFTVFATKARPALLVFLIIGILVNFDFHLTYVEGYVGISDGVVIGNFQICLMLLVLLALFGPNRHRFRFFPPTTVPFLAMILAGIFSFVNSNDHTLSFYGLLSWIETFVFYFYIANHVKTVKELKLILLALQIGMFIQGGVCILQFALKTNFTLNFQVFGQDPYSTVFRAGGVTGSPNYAAPYMAGIIPVTFAQFLILDNKKEKLFAGAALLLGAVGVLLTFSRATWLALFSAMLPTSFLLMKQGLLRFRRLAWALLPVLVLVIVFQDAILSRVGEGSENLENRANLFTTAANMITAHPLLGIGINTYTAQMAAYTVREMYYHWDYMVHSKYLLLWSETGIGGVLSFVAIAIIALISALRLTRRQDRFVATIGAGVFGAILVYAIHMNFESYNCCIDLNQYWLMVALTAALGTFGCSAPEQQREE